MARPRRRNRNAKRGRAPRSNAASAVPPEPAAERAGPAERGLVFAIRAGLALLLLTPLVVLPDVFSPHAVGKALYTRGLIAVLFALWAVLAALRSTWRPQLSWLVVLFAAGLATAAVSAVFGVSLQRSLWSTYTRMGGLVDAVHWLALAVVLVAMLRTTRDWCRILNLYLGAGLAVALLAIARFHFPETFGLGWWHERHYPRIGVFEAAARHESFVLAGEELGITAAGVGHRVRTLEKHLGAELFERRRRSVHTMASHAVMNGVPVPVVSRLLGHSNVRMTLRYAHLADREVEAAAERVGTAIARIMGLSLQMPPLDTPNGGSSG